MRLGKIYSKFLVLEFYKVLSANEAMIHCWALSKVSRNIMIVYFEVFREFMIKVHHFKGVFNLLNEQDRLGAVFRSSVGQKLSFEYL